MRDKLLAPRPELRVAGIKGIRIRDVYSAGVYQYLVGRGITAAVRLNNPEHAAIDFSDFLASALVAVAVNVGSVERIIAGRPARGNLTCSPSSSPAPSGTTPPRRSWPLGARSRSSSGSTSRS